MIPESALNALSRRRYELLTGAKTGSKIRPRLGDHVDFASLQLRILGALSLSKSMGPVLFEAGRRFTKQITAEIFEIVKKFPGWVSFTDAENLEAARASTEFAVFQMSYQQTHDALLRLTEYEKNRLIVVQSEECSDCYGVGNLGKSICYFSGGSIAGILESRYERSVGFVESKCYAKGDSCCEFRYSLWPVKER